MGLKTGVIAVGTLIESTNLPSSTYILRFSFMLLVFQVTIISIIGIGMINRDLFLP